MPIEAAYSRRERLVARFKGLARRSARVDRQIDRLVHEKYGLTEEEIKIVDGNC